MPRGCGRCARRSARRSSCSWMPTVISTLSRHQAGRDGEAYGISFFEEPLTQNDVPAMAQLRRSTGMALACGQNEDWRFASAISSERGDRLRPAQRRHHRRIFAMREDRRNGGGVQRLDCQRRRLGLPQHAPAAGVSTARWSSTIISRSNCTADLSRSAGARGRLFHHAGYAGLGSSPTAMPSARSPSCRCRRRGKVGAAVAGGAINPLAPHRAALAGRRVVAAPTCAGT